ncbi:MAG: 5'-methylthioadenosine/adenosylhomocysteine nucleosidase [Oscillospiraceae bacterium]|nr:5'-methylthioadenosine/adenosylhomocysteine nucleosidase [Oscillospiraceae bacterium]
MKLGIIGAMDVEVATLKDAMENKVEKTFAGSVYCEGTLEKLPVVIVQCGIGKVNAAMCAQVLCDCFGVTHIVNTGIAGSLNAKLDIGDFVISNEAVYHDFDVTALGYTVGQVPGLDVRAFPADKMLTELAYNVADGVCPGHVQIGTVASGDQFVCSKEQKQAIVANTGGLCTEMEGAAIAHTAWKNGVPYVVIRAISDKADDSAEMDYPTFEAIAAKRCAEVTRAMAKALLQN